MEMADFSRGVAQLEGYSLPYYTHGEGPLLLCLHGFPDSPHGFAHQLGFFADAGYRVVAPYMRGYAPGSTPPGGTYQPAAFAEDTVALIDALGYERADLYGHDWGTAAAYATAVLHPGRVGKLVAAAVPYGNALPTALLTDPAQQRRSWYVFFFQTPLAELSVPLDDYAFIDRLWRDWSPGGFPDAALAAAKRTLAEPGVLAAALAYYRSAMGTLERDPALAEAERRIGHEAIGVPSLYVHGADDGCIAPGISDGMDGLFSAGLERLVLPNAGHFVHMEAPEAFNRAVLAFLRG